MAYGSTQDGLSFTQLAVSLARGNGVPIEALQFAVRKYGNESAPAQILRAAVNPETTTSDAALSYASDASESFVSAVRPRTVLGRMAGVRTAPANTRFPRVTTGSGSRWVGETLPIGVTSLA